MKFAGRPAILLSIFLLGAVAGYSETGTPTITTNEATAVTASSAELHGTINTGGKSVGGWFEWGTTSSLGKRTDSQVFADGTTSVTLVASISYLEPHTTYYFRAVLYPAVAGSPNLNGEIRTFTTAGDAVTATNVVATTGEATALTSSAATLKGTVNPGGGSVSAWFDWGTSTSLGNRTEMQTIPSGTEAVAVTLSLTKLQPHTVYYFRVDAYRPGAYALGDIKTFTTSDAPAAAPVTVTTGDASGITSNSATLNGKITAGGSLFGGWFEYGSSQSLGTRTEVQTFGESMTTVNLTQTLKNLHSNTTYYFRAVAYRSGGTMPGDISSFTTTPETPASLRVETVEASTVSSLSAELRGLINPGGTTATGWFEWGSSSLLSNHTTAQTFDGSQPSRYSFSPSNLQPNTRYYFRAVGQNASGMVRGEVKMFTTTRVPATPPQSISEVEAGEIKSGYVVITPDASSDAPTVTFTYGTISRGAVQSQAGIVPSMMATDASMFVEVIPSISRNIGVAIANPGNNVNAVTVTLRDENGFVLGSPTNVSVPAHQQMAKFVNELFGADVISAGFRGSLRMQSASPFAVTGLRFAGAVFSTLPVAVTAGVPGVPATTLVAGPTANSPAPGTVGSTTAVLIPQFAIAGGWATQIAFVNNTNATLVGRIDVFDTSGRPMPVKMNGETRSTFTYSIPVGGTFVLAPRDSNGQSPL